MTRTIAVSGSKNAKAHTREIADKVAATTTDCDVDLAAELAQVDAEAAHPLDTLRGAMTLCAEDDEDQLATLAAAGVVASIAAIAEDIPVLNAARSVTLEDINGDGGNPYLSVLSIENASGETIWPPELVNGTDERNEADDILADDLFPEFAVMLDRRMGRLQQQPTDKLGNLAWKFNLAGNTDALGDGGRDTIFDGLRAESNDAEFSALAHVAELLGVKWDEDEESDNPIALALQGDSDDEVRNVLADLAAEYCIDYTDYNADEDDDD